MTKVARYVVVVDREVGESDGGGVYHDGTAPDAIAQVVRELQEAWNSGAVDGFFQVHSREIVDGFDAPIELPAPWFDDPGAPLPVTHPAPRPTRQVVTLAVTDAEVRALRHWFTVSSDFGDVLHATDVDLIELLNRLAAGGAVAAVPEAEPLDRAVAVLSELVVAHTKGGLNLPEKVWEAVREADYFINSARDAYVEVDRLAEDPACRACPDSLPHPPHVLPCADGWWENDENWVSGTERPPAATHWFWTIGDEWDAVRGETVEDWFSDSTEAERPDPCTYPIDQRPPFGTLRWRNTDGDHTLHLGGRP